MSLIRLRQAGPNEHRCIIRQALGFYRTLVVGGLYTSNQPIENESILTASLFCALEHCISRHPILSAVILDAESEKPRFAKPTHLDLGQHIVIEPAVSASDDWRSACKPFFLSVLDAPLSTVDGAPPWKVHVLPLTSSSSSSSSSRYVILFGYAHSHGDGMSGLTFLRTLLAGLDKYSSAEGKAKGAAVSVCHGRVPSTPHALLPTLEQSGKLTVSLSYLLSPLLGDLLPEFIAGPLGVRATAIPDGGPGAWRGREDFFYDEGGRNDGHVSGAMTIGIAADTLGHVLAACRRQNVRLTGLIHQVVVRSLSEQLPDNGQASSFVSQSAVDMRRLLPSAPNLLGTDEMGVCVTGYYEAFPRADPPTWQDWTTTTDTNHPVWKAARTTTQGLAQQASTLKNQPVGLLKYLSNFRSWTLGHIGKKREAAYELSNLTVFDPYRGRERVDESSNGKESQNRTWTINGLIFGQPANVTGGAFDVNIVSLKDGELTATLTWQRGALGLGQAGGGGGGGDGGEEGGEDEFMAKVAAGIERSFTELAEAHTS